MVQGISEYHDKSTEKGSSPLILYFVSYWLFKSIIFSLKMDLLKYIYIFGREIASKIGSKFLCTYRHKLLLIFTVYIDG